MRIRSSWLAVLVAGSAAFSGEPLTWERLVGSFSNDLSLQATRQKVTELSSTRGFQLWDEVEVRYGAKRADLRKQEVDLRVSPVGFGELGANRNLDRARATLGRAVLRRETAETIRNRYRMALDWLYQTRQRKFHLDMQELARQRIQVLAKLTGDSRFEPEDLVRTQVDLVEYVSKTEGDLYSLAQIENRMRRYVPDFDGVRLEGELLTPAEIEANLKGVDPASCDSFPDALVANRKLEIASARTQKEVAASRRWISYLQAGYTFDVDENRLERATHRDNISFGAGVVIPLFDGGASNIARRRADLAEARLEFQDQRDEIERDVSNLQLSIGSMARQITVLDSFATKVDAGGLFAEFALKSGGDPLLVLQARETSVQNSWKIEKLRFQMLADYLEILHRTGALVDEPGVHHLLSRKPPLALAPAPRGDAAN
ncbi:MAG: TolC family protein [Fibrobacteria bacterium]|nr:TolC family protein [Fibrobacteria bacterium]